MDDLTSLLVKHEGLRLKVYDDATGKAIDPGDCLLGHPTIGVGRALDTNGITQPEALFLLQDDIDRVKSELNTALPWWVKLDYVRQAVLISMAFNMGTHGLLTFHDTLKAAEEGRYVDAAAAMLQSQWATQVGARATELAAMMKSGTYP